MARYKKHFKQVIVLSAFVITLISCADLKKGIHNPTINGDTFDWDKQDPMDFLNFLKEHRHNDCPTYVIYEIQRTWIKENHLSQLMAIIDSSEPCANVCSVYSSFMDCRLSTLGQEAAFLIKGYREGRYPPDLNSGRTDINKEELNSWWQNHSATLNH